MASTPDDQDISSNKGISDNEDTLNNQKNSNLYFQVIIEEFLNFVNEPRVMRFLVQIFIMITGFILLKILADRGFPLVDTLQFMGIWFILILFLPIPKSAKTDINPFGEGIGE